MISAPGAKPQPRFLTETGWSTGSAISVPIARFGGATNSRRKPTRQRSRLPGSYSSSRDCRTTASSCGKARAASIFTIVRLGVAKRRVATRIDQAHNGDSGSLRGSRRTLQDARAGYSRLGFFFGKFGQALIGLRRGQHIEPPSRVCHRFGKDAGLFGKCAPIGRADPPSIHSHPVPKQVAFGIGRSRFVAHQDFPLIEVRIFGKGAVKCRVPNTFLRRSKLRSQLSPTGSPRRRHARCN